MIGHQALPADVVAAVRRQAPAILAHDIGVVVVTTLKPGAPQLLAELVLSLGGSLHVVVPAEGYDASFPGGKEREAYRAMLGRASTVQRLGHPHPSEDAFVAAGRTVVDQSDLVLAVWDGRPARRPSGTAGLVRYASERGKPVRVLWVKKLFLSYRFADSRLVSRVHYHLRKQPSVETYFWGRDARPGVDTWIDQVGAGLEEAAGGLVAFAGDQPGDTQLREIQDAQRRGLPVCLVCLDDAAPAWARVLGSPHNVVSSAPGLSERALEYARDVVRWFNLAWVHEDGVPLTYLFDYEKHVIEAYAEGPIDDRNFGEGAPETWPPAVRKAPHRRPNTVSTNLIGNHRAADSHIIVDARAAIATGAARAQTFLEALPRTTLHHPVRNQLTVRVLVSGGVAPGTNAVISEIARRHEMYAEADPPHTLSVRGYVEGFYGLVNNMQTVDLLGEDTREIAHRGGSRLGTSRLRELIGTDPADRRLVERILGMLGNVDILYVIGGDGSMRAAHALSTVAAQIGSDLSVIGIPKTTDNDILWVWQSFGHLSSVQRARDFLLELHTEVTSNPRLCVVQLFGSDSGFVVANAGLGSGVCNAVLVPEAPFALSKVSEHLWAVLSSQLRRQEMPHAILLIAETAIPSDASRYLADEAVGLSAGEREAVKQFLRDDRRVRGQTPDELRTAGAKMVTRVLEREIQAKGGYWGSFHVFANEPRHLIRAMAPSASDVIFGERLGANAVDAAMAGFHDCMVSQWLTEFVLVPLDLVVLGRKRLPLEGAFWKAVLAGTGQPDFTE